MYNDATAYRPIKIMSLQYVENIGSIGSLNEHVATDRIHINNQTGTVTLGPNNWWTEPDGNRVAYGTIEDALTGGNDNLSASPRHTDHRFVVNGRSRMNGRLHIEGDGEYGTVEVGFQQNQSGSSDFSSGDGGYPLLKVESQDKNDDNKFLVHFKSEDDDNAKILKLEAATSKHSPPGANGAHFIDFEDDEGLIGSIRQTSAVGITYAETSDIRLKTNIKPINELDKLLKLNPVSYNWKQDQDGKKEIGLIAQEVDKVYPNLVDKSDEERFMMNYKGLIPILLSGIKEQQKMIDSLEERIKKLENK